MLQNLCFIKSSILRSVLQYVTIVFNSNVLNCTELLEFASNILLYLRVSTNFNGFNILHLVQLNGQFLLSTTFKRKYFNDDGTIYCKLSRCLEKNQCNLKYLISLGNIKYLPIKNSFHPARCVEYFSRKRIYRKTWLGSIFISLCFSRF